MTDSIAIAFHGWRGLGRDIEPDLFAWRCRFGVMTLTVCRVCWLTAYWNLKQEAQRLRAELENATREADRLRRTIIEAVAKVASGKTDGK